MGRSLIAHRYALCALAIGAAALGLRVAYVLAYAPTELPLNDGLWFHLQANDLVDGHFFVNPGLLHFFHRAQPSASHPPLFPLVLAAVSFMGGTSLLAHQLTECALEALAAVVIGLAAREVAGDRVGLIATAIAAVYPWLCVSEGQVFSEGLFGLLIAVMLLASYRFWRHPRPSKALQLGLAVGAAALCRAEALLYVPLLALPLVVLVPGAQPRRRVGLLAVVGTTVLVVIAPWTVVNTLRFEKPFVMTSSLGVLVAGANCDDTYYGRALGGWSFECVKRAVPGDESEQSETMRRLGEDYARDHVGRLPLVVGARVARTWELYDPPIKPTSNATWSGLVGLIGFYALVPIAVLGALIHKRREGTPTFPLLVPACAVTLTVALTWGHPRFRMPADVAFIVLAAIAFEALSHRRNAPDCHPPPEARSSRGTS
jgi:4-amino-4-deoxy-L-arabinose transferase-like glycosyltransferase